MLTILAILGLAALLALYSFTSASATPTGTGQTLETMGASGPRPEGHVVAFATTDTTVEVKTSLKTIVAWSFGHAGTPDGDDDVLSIDETVSAFGQIIVPSGGQITVKRPAGTQSGQVFSMILWGI